MLDGGNVDDRRWVWLIRLCELLMLVLIDWLTPRWKPNGNNNVNGFNYINSRRECDILSLVQRYGGRQGYEGAECDGRG